MSFCSRSSLPDPSGSKWDVCDDCLLPLANDLDGLKEQWFRPPREVVDDERDEHFEVYELHVQLCLSARTVETLLGKYNLDRAILWMKANQREILAREAEAKQADILSRFREPIPTGIDQRNQRAQMLADFAWHLWRVAQGLGAIKGGGPQLNWYHEAHEEPPPGFKKERSIKGTKRKLSICLGDSPDTKNPRRLESEGRREEEVWIRRLRGQTFEVFFRTQDAYARANQKKIEFEREKSEARWIGAQPKTT